MTQQIDAMKLALKDLRCMASDLGRFENEIPSIKAIKKALAQPEQEPDYWLGYGLQAHTEKPFEGATPLYTNPPQRKPLTDEEIDRLWSQSLADTEGETWLPLREFARTIEAAHGIKENT